MPLRLTAAALLLALVQLGLRPVSGPPPAVEERQPTHRYATFPSDGFDDYWRDVSLGW